MMTMFVVRLRCETTLKTHVRCPARRPHPQVIVVEACAVSAMEVQRTNTINTHEPSDIKKTRLRSTGVLYQLLFLNRLDVLYACAYSEKSVKTNSLARAQTLNLHAWCDDDEADGDPGAIRPRLSLLQQRLRSDDAAA